MSLIYIRNSSGPKLLPCGTPQVTGFEFDRWSLTQHFWVRSVRYDLPHLRLFGSTPQFPNFCNIILWSNVPNAFFKSIKTTPLTRPLSMLTDQLLVASNNAVKVLCNDRKPDEMRSRDCSH